MLADERQVEEEGDSAEVGVREWLERAVEVWGLQTASAAEEEVM